METKARASYGSWPGGVIALPVGPWGGKWDRIRQDITRRANVKPMQAPQKTTWIICLVLAIVTLISSLFTIPLLTDLAPWLGLVGTGLMLAATQLDNL